MENSYRIKKVPLDQAQSPNVWETVTPVKIGCFPWDTNQYRPEVLAWVFYTETHFHVKFAAYETEIRAVNKNYNDPVCQDSCVEFFMNPNPHKDDRYLNFEVNPMGTMLLGIGKNRFNRSHITNLEDFASFAIMTSVSEEDVKSYGGDWWSVQYIIPFAFLEKIYGKLNFTSGAKLKANFYKCGDCTAKPHYGCWNRVESPKPDFHRPECFAELLLE